MKNATKIKKTILLFFIITIRQLKWDEEVSQLHKQIQIIIDKIDASIKEHGDEKLTLTQLSDKLGYSGYCFKLWLFFS